MIEQPSDLTPTPLRRVCCDGAAGIRAAMAPPAALGHPRVWLEIDERGWVDCPYCERRFVLDGGAADSGAH